MASCRRRVFTSEQVRDEIFADSDSENEANSDDSGSYEPSSSGESSEGENVQSENDDDEPPVGINDEIQISQDCDESLRSSRGTGRGNFEVHANSNVRLLVRLCSSNA